VGQFEPDVIGIDRRHDARQRLVNRQGRFEQPVLVRVPVLLEGIPVGSRIVDIGIERPPARLQFPHQLLSLCSVQFVGCERCDGARDGWTQHYVCPPDAVQDGDGVAIIDDASIRIPPVLEDRFNPVARRIIDGARLRVSSEVDVCEQRDGVDVPVSRQRAIVHPVAAVVVIEYLRRPVV